jgi:hypothetical protein
VFEIKATDWDRIKPENIRWILAAHVRQILSYVDAYPACAAALTSLSFYVYPPVVAQIPLRSFQMQFRAALDFPERNSRMP